jgi:hypothetical protein
MILIGILAAAIIAVGLGTLIWIAKEEYDIHVDLTDKEIHEQLTRRNQ